MISTIVKRPGRKVRTGFCSNGQCEGTKPKNFKGDSLKTCPLFLTCACSCHYDLDKMYEQAGAPRVLLTNPDYHPSKIKFLMPDPAEVLAQKNARLLAEGKRPITEQTEDSILTGEAFDKTESGYRAKGQLEYQVFVACAKICWPSAITTITPITPKVIAEYITRHENIERPSPGAIQAIWDRWVKYNFATYAKGPVRFTGFTGFEDVRPEVKDLDTAREKYKRIERMSSTANRRNKIQGLRPKS